jgi:undecaprenyl-diphosphatase
MDGPDVRRLQQSRWSFLVRWIPWLTVGVALVLVAAFVELSEELLQDQEQSARLLGIDVGVLRVSASLRRPWLSAIAMDLTALGSPLLVAMFTFVLGALLLAGGDRRGAGVLAATSFASGLLTVATKTLLERPRPDVVPRLVYVTGLSYPSGHALASAGVYLTASFIVARHLTSLWERAAAVGFTTFFTAVIGASRIYLGAHYPSDVLGGILLGTALALIAAMLLRRLDSSRRSENRRLSAHPGKGDWGAEGRGLSRRVQR